MSIEAVLFDLDNTLYDREAAFRQWALVFAGEHLGLGAGAQRALLADIHAWGNDGYGSKKSIFERLVGLYPELLDNTPSSVDLFYDQFIAQMTLEAETELLLDTLSQNIVSCGVVTSGLARQWHKIERFGLRRRTSCLFVSGTFGCHKPAPEIFRAAADCLGASPEDVLFVGDHPIADIVGASRVGMQTAWLHRGMPWPADAGAVRPDHVLDNLRELRAANILGFPCVQSGTG